MYSLTQTGNIVSAVMFFVNILNINVSGTEVETIVTATVGIVGVLISWYGRYRKGDITLAGFHKEDEYGN